MFAERLLGWRDEGSANWIIDGDAGLGLLPSPPHGVWMGLRFVAACLDRAELRRFLGSWSGQVLGLSWVIFLEEKSAQTHQALLAWARLCVGKWDHRGSPASLVLARWLSDTLSYSSLIQKFLKTFIFSARTAVLELPEAGARQSAVSLVSPRPTMMWAGKPSKRAKIHQKSPLRVPSWLLTTTQNGSSVCPQGN